MPNINALLANLDNTRRNVSNNIMELLNDPMAAFQRSASRFMDENLPTPMDVQDARSVMPGMGNALQNKVGALATNALSPGIFAGAGAVTADMPKLFRAVQMHGQGLPRDQIWQETGWFRGPEGRWRHEIGDDTSYLRGHMNTGDFRNDVPLPDVMRHKDLYEAYPDLANIRVNIERPTIEDWARGGISGGFDNRTGTMTIRPPTADMAHSTALHELQHAVQYADGFPTGGAPSNAISRVAKPVPEHYKAVQEALQLKTVAENVGVDLDELIKYNRPSALAESIARKFSLDDLQHVLDRARGIRDQTPESAYRRLAGEAEARAVQKRRDMSPDERKATPPWSSYDIPWQNLYTDYK